ncbi:MAG: tRNA (guanosine(46)-N7)-methyltransferase TrmB [Oscillospiraceae bacterium]
MRMRRKPWARPELAACPFCVQIPAEHKGHWHEMFKNNNPIHIELGCGKGGFISKVAHSHLDINYLAIDVKSEMLGLAKRNIEREYNGDDVSNIHIMALNIEQIDLIFSEEDFVERIYINFCNPWPRGKHKKRRLTFPRQLNQYKIFLKKGGEIWFKTDNDELFEESIPYFDECGFEIKYQTTDLHNSGFSENVETEHEKMFTEMGLTTKFLIAVNK